MTLFFVDWNERMSESNILAIVERFVSATNLKIETMSNDYNELNNAGWTACSIMNSLRNEAHQLAGSGATVGFPEVSKAASSLDALLMSILERGNGVSKEEESQISVLFEHLERQCFSINPYDSEILNEDFTINFRVENPDQTDQFVISYNPLTSETP